MRIQRTLVLVGTLLVGGGSLALAAQTPPATLTLRTLDGSSIRGRFEDSVLVFVSSLGRSRIRTKDVATYDAGMLTLADATVLKGKFEGLNIRFRTSAGVLTIPTSQLVGVGSTAISQQSSAPEPSRPPTQPTPSAPEVWPTAYGWFARGAQATTPLPEVKVETLLGLAIRPNNGYAVDGIRGNPAVRLPPGTLRFIVYQQGIIAANLRLAGMGYVQELQAGQLNDKPMRPDIFRSVFGKNSTDIVRVGLWRPNQNIPLTIEPVRDHPDMFQLIPADPLAPGRYALYEKSTLYDYGDYFPINQPRNTTARYFLVDDPSSATVRTPFDSILASVPDDVDFDAVTQDFQSPQLPVWLAIQRVFADKKDIVVASNNRPPVLVTEGVHGGIFKNLDRYYLWMEMVNPGLTRVHVKLMRYVRDIDKGTFTRNEERTRTRKAAQDFLGNVQKALAAVPSNSPL